MTNDQVGIAGVGVSCSQEVEKVGDWLLRSTC